MVTIQASARQAEAVLILVDFNSAVGSTSGADTNGNYWTTIAAAGNTLNLVDTSNVPTTADLNLTLGGGGFTGFAGAAANNADTGTTAITPFSQPFAYRDALFTSATSGVGITIALTDLLPNTLHTFQVYNRRTASGADASVSIILGSGSPATASHNAVSTFSATSTAGGEITIRYLDSNPDGNVAMLNALSISFVPEPSCLALAGLGLIGFGVVRRRRNVSVATRN